MLYMFFLLELFFSSKTFNLIIRKGEVGSDSKVYNLVGTHRSVLRPRHSDRL